MSNSPAHPSRRLLPFALALALAALAGVAVLSGCETSPEAGHLDNPFDPDGDAGGDALGLIAAPGYNKVTLIWTEPAGHVIVSYSIYRTTDLADGFRELDSIEGIGAGSYTYIDTDALPSTRVWYLVQAVGADGSTSLISQALARAAGIGPRVLVNDTTLTAVTTRFPELSVTAGIGDTLLVATEPTFAAPLAVPVPDPSLPVVFTYDLGPAARGDTISLLFKAAGVPGALVTGLDLRVTFGPEVNLATASPLKLARRVNDLKIADRGVVRMRFAHTKEELDGATWVPGAAIYPDFALIESANPQRIWGEFEGDFGYTTTDSLDVRPDLLTSAAFLLKVPDSRTVSSRTITTEQSAGALEMRISENPVFTDVPWIAYSDTLNFVLSPEPGLKTIYAQFRNDWTESIVMTDYCTYLAAGIDVDLGVPAPGTVVEGGSTLVVRGTASGGTLAASIDSVRLDLGDGLGFREVIGRENWQLTWNVPLLEADTERVIRARAWASGTDTVYVATDAFAITISQLTVGVTSPLDGGRFASGGAVTINGTAGPILGGAPIDSVVVDADGTHLQAAGTEVWDTTWTVPAVGADTPVDITATAWAGERSVSRTISVTLTPPAGE